MNFSALKRFFSALSIYSIIPILFFSSIAQAADIQAQLDNTAGSGLSVQNFSNVEKARINNAGDLYAIGNVGIGTSNTYSSALNIGNTSQFSVSLATGSVTTSGSYTQSGGLSNLFSGTTTFNNGTYSALFLSGNVGINSTHPGQTLDVAGSLRTTNFAMTSGTPIGGYVLTALDTSGNATWSPTSSVGAWIVTNSNDVFLPNNGNVGIGTNITGASALSVMNGNVGIGTWVPGNILSINASSPTVSIKSTNGDANLLINGAGESGWRLTEQAGTGNFFIHSNNSPIGDKLTIDVNGNVTQAGNLAVQGTGFTTIAGNVGIGSLSPGQQLDINGTLRTVGFAMPTGAPAFGYVLTAQDSNGNAAWSTTNSVGAWTITNTNDVYLPNNGNVGIGTNKTSTAALTVMNGNVGIGTWVPAASLQVNGTSQNTYIASSGNIGIGTVNPTQALEIGNGGANPAAIIRLNDGNDNQEIIFANGGIERFRLRQNNAGLNFESLSAGAGGVGRFFNFSGGTIGNGDLNNAVMTISGVWNDNTNNYYGLVVNPTNTASGAGSAIADFRLGGLSKMIIQSSGNVGIGSINPGQKLDVQGTLRTVGFAMSTGTPAFGYVLTAQDSNGNAAWSTTNSVGAWTLTNTNDVYLPNNGNVGIGTTITVGAALSVMNGNVGIGTWVPGGALTVMNGNVGIGVANPTTVLQTQTNWVGPGTKTNIISNVVSDNNENSISELLDLQYNGTSFVKVDYTGALTLSQNAGNILSGVGIGRNGEIWQDNTNGNDGLYLNFRGYQGGYTQFRDVYIYDGKDINELAIFQGSTARVGIMNSTPGYTLDIKAHSTDNPFNVANAGGLSRLMVSSQGNVGIGSTAPGQTLDVNGTIRTTNFAMTSGTPIGGYVLTALDTSGNATWSSTSSVGAWTITNTNDVYLPNNGNVGIGTTITAGAALTVMNGNVGIGTWVPAYPLDVNGIGKFGNAKIYGDSSSDVYIGPAASTAGGTADTALGGNASAGGTYATALGYNTAASGYNSLAIGDAAQATHNTSIAIGASSQSLHDFSTVIGYGVISTTSNQLILGGFNNIENVPAIENWLTIVPTSRGNAPVISLGSAAGTNVGIGSANPGQALDVQGTIRTVGFAMPTGAPAFGYVLTAQDSNGNAAWSTTNSVGAWTLTNTNDVYLPNNGNVGIGTTITAGAALSVMNGNVGIGTWVPASALDVLGAIKQRATSALPNMNTYLNTNANTLSDTSNLNPGLLVYASAGYAYGVDLGYNAPNYRTRVFAPYNQDIAFSFHGAGSPVSQASFTDAMVVKGTGNVGIGSLNPGQKLDVQGTIRTVGFAMPTGTPAFGYVLTAQDSNGNAAWSTTNSVGAWTLTNTNDVYLPSNGNVGIGTTITAGAALTVMNGNVGIGTWVPALPFSVIGDSYHNGNVGIGTTLTTTAALTVMNGNVGIGTWVPSKQFAVGSNAFTVDSLGNTTVGSYNLGTVTPAQLIFGNYQPGGSTRPEFIFNGNLQWMGLGQQDTGSDNNLRLGALTGPNTGWSAYGAYTFNLSIDGGLSVGSANIAPTNGLLVNGNVGIGSIAPGQLLDVQGTVRVLGGGSVGIGTSLVSASALTVMSGNVGIGTWVPAQPLQVKQGTGSLVVDTNGNVGIGGLTNPAKALDIGPSVGTDIQMWADGGGANLYGNSANAMNYGNLNTGPTYFTEGGAGVGSAKMTILNSGNVGIGSTNPGQVLDVHGSVRMTGINIPVGAGATYVLTSDANGNGTWQPVTGSGTVNNGNQNQVAYYAGTGTVLSGATGLIYDGTNIGVGSTAPGQILDVQGTARVSGNVGIGSSITDSSGSPRLTITSTSVEVNLQ